MKCLGIEVARENAQSVVKYLLKKDLVRKDLKIASDLKSVRIPVKNGARSLNYVIRSLDFSPRMMQVSPRKEMLRIARADGIRCEVPRKWIRLGDSVIIKKGCDVANPEIYPIMAKILNVGSIYVEEGGIHGDTRVPSVRLVFGKHQPVLHVENGIRYNIDPQRLMFSPGNVNERIGHGRISLDGKTVLDMFAGIGYFSLPIAKYAHVKRVYASEVNPQSYGYLRQNVEKNGLGERVESYRFDCRELPHNLLADYIIMGHFGCRSYLSSALLHSRKNTIINMHLLVPTEHMEDHWLEIAESARELGYLVDFVDQHIVKSYSPHLWHVSLDLRIARLPD